MPTDNRFQHQQYDVPDSPPIEVEVAAVKADEHPHIDVRSALQHAGISRILLVHGTFMGSDPFGLVDKLERFGRIVPQFLRPVLQRLPSAATLRRINDATTTYATGEVANYTDDYVSDFQKLMGDDVQVERFVWSSENNHIGRADAAVRLLCRLSETGENERWLLWGHSHAGNVFALLTNLLANHRESVERFFEIGRTCADNQPDWQRTCDILNRADADTAHPIARSLDIVTFGTPIRYGWDTHGYSRLLHVNNHRPTAGLAEYRTKAPFPQSANDILNAEHGDWVQALGIAGTNIIAVDISRRKADAEFQRFLERNLSVTRTFRYPVATSRCYHNEPKPSCKTCSGSGTVGKPTSACRRTVTKHYCSITAEVLMTHECSAMASTRDADGCRSTSRTSPNG